VISCSGWDSEEIRKKKDFHLCSLPISRRTNVRNIPLLEVSRSRTQFGSDWVFRSIYDHQRMHLGERCEAELKIRATRPILTLANHYVQTSVEFKGAT
jgi:hypothetical protein